MLLPIATHEGGQNSRNHSVAFDLDAMPVTDCTIKSMSAPLRGSNLRKMACWYVEWIMALYIVEVGNHRTATLMSRKIGNAAQPCPLHKIVTTTMVDSTPMDTSYALEALCPGGFYSFSTQTMARSHLWSSEARWCRWNIWAAHASVTLKSRNGGKL